MSVWAILDGLYGIVLSPILRTGRSRNDDLKRACVGRTDGKLSAATQQAQLLAAMCNASQRNARGAYRIYLLNRAAVVLFCDTYRHQCTESGA